MALYELAERLMPPMLLLVVLPLIVLFFDPWYIPMPSCVLLSAVLPLMVLKELASSRMARPELKSAMLHKIVLVSEPVSRLMPDCPLEHKLSPVIVDMSTLLK